MTQKKRRKPVQRDARFVSANVLPYLSLRRSFSELYQKAIKDAECKPGEDQSGEAWVLDDREEEEEEGQEEAVAEDEPPPSESEEEERLRAVKAEDGESEGQPCDGGDGERSLGPLLAPPSLPLLRATSLQEPPTNQSQEDTQRPRSCSLERRPSLREACDG